ncbi:MAG TPA: dienelactone hydrolase family protein [Saliniramus sp.]|nr:dienelactone hydrolase family protein [Saliniramus sp.]
MNEQKPRITQDIIKLYDEYTHLTLDRRGFMDKLAKLTGSAAAAAAIVPLVSANAAKAAIVAPDDARLEAQMITYPGESGDVEAYLAMPADRSGPLPAVIVIHENRGLNPHIMDVTRRIALEGFVALGIDFLSPAGGTPPDEDRAREMIGELNSETTVANAVAAVAFLSEHEATNGKVGAVGFCWGGGMVNQLAVASPDLAAGVVYYGSSPAAEQVSEIQARMLLHYAALDERINAGVPAYEEALKAADVDYTLHMYEDVNHAFNNDTSAARYDEEAANLAFERTIAFFRETLS